MFIGIDHVTVARHCTKTLSAPSPSRQTGPGASGRQPRGAGAGTSRPSPTRPQPRPASAGPRESRESVRSTFFTVAPAKGPTVVGAKIQDPPDPCLRGERAATSAFSGGTARTPISAPISATVSRRAAACRIGIPVRDRPPPSSRRRRRGRRRGTSPR